MNITIYIDSENSEQFVNEPSKSGLINTLLRLHYTSPTPVKSTEIAKTDKPTPEQSYGNKDINIIVENFMRLFGQTKTTKYDRFAANRLIKKYQDPNRIVNILAALAHYQGEEYAPSANSISEFEKKLPSILSFLRKQSNNKKGMVSAL